MNGDVLLTEAPPHVKIPGYMTTDEAAKYLSISTGRVRQLVSEGVFPREKIGNTNLIPVASIELYEKNRGKAGWPKGKKRNS